MVMENSTHVGHMFLEIMRNKLPGEIFQVDAATGEKETNASVLRRSVRLAQSLRRLGLVPGDVLVLGGRNHIDLHIPHYAALLNGLPVVGLDPSCTPDEIRPIFQLTAPKVAFCEPEHRGVFVQITEDLGLSTKVITFGDGEGSLRQLISRESTPIDEFISAEFDQDKVYAWLVATGGTSGKVKLAAIKHQALKSCLITNKNTILYRKSHSGTNDPALFLTSVQWISGFILALKLPIMNKTKIQTSAPATVEHVIDIINEYQPTFGMFLPAFMSGILRSSKPCDLTCLHSILLGGVKVFPDILTGLKERVRDDTDVVQGYGQTEHLGLVFQVDPSGPIESCGRLAAGDQAKLVDPVTGKDITMPNVPGELWTKMQRFTEYYKNPEETAKVFTEDGWFKTGDLLYMNENGQYFIVERLAMLIEYQKYFIVPAEIEEVIHGHPGVQEVSVTFVPHVEDIEHPVACVVRRPGAAVSAEDIKNIVAENLSNENQLHGGVIFMEKLPRTKTGKIARAQLQKIACKVNRE